MGPCGVLVDFSITTAFRLNVSISSAGLNSRGGRFTRPCLKIQEEQMNGYVFVSLCLESIQNRKNNLFVLPPGSFVFALFGGVRVNDVGSETLEVSRKR